MDYVLKYMVMVDLITVLAALVAVLCLVSSMPDLPKTVRTNQICLPNELGTLGCGKTTDLLHEYLQRTTSNTYENMKTEQEKLQQDYLETNKVRLMAIYDKTFWEMKPAAKFTGKQQPEPRESDLGAEMTPIRLWRHGRELYDTSGFSRYGIRYINGRLVVPVSGTYFVYSSLDLFEPCVPETGVPNVADSSKPIKHGIYKFNILHEAETEVISSVQPHTISSNKQFNLYSSYIASLVQLKAGDELSVKISNLTYLRYTSRDYFGLNLI